MENKRFVNYSTVHLIVCAGAQNYSRDVSQLTQIPPITKLSTVLVGVSWRFR